MAERMARGAACGAPAACPSFARACLFAVCVCTGVAAAARRPRSVSQQQSTQTAEQREGRDDDRCCCLAVGIGAHAEQRPAVMPVAVACPSGRFWKTLPHSLRHSPATLVPHATMPCPACPLTPLRHGGSVVAGDQEAQGVQHGQPGAELSGWRRVHRSSGCEWKIFARTLHGAGEA